MIAQALQAVANVPDTRREDLNVTIPRVRDH
jgi:hypothetical protein